MTTSKHEAKTGAKAGQWVTCTAQPGNCRNKGRHITDSTLAAVRELKNQTVGKNVPLSSITRVDIQAYDKKTDAEKEALHQAVITERKAAATRRKERATEKQEDAQMVANAIAEMPALLKELEEKNAAKQNLTRPYSQKTREAYESSINAALSFLATKPDASQEEVDARSIKFTQIIKRDNVMKPDFAHAVTNVYLARRNNTYLGKVEYSATAAWLLNAKTDVEDYKPIGTASALVEKQHAEAEAKKQAEGKVAQEARKARLAAEREAKLSHKVASSIKNFFGKSE